MSKQLSPLEPEPSPLEHESEHEVKHAPEHVKKYVPSPWELELVKKANKVPTRQILIVFNLQNEFASPQGHLPCNDLSFVDRIKVLVPKFRQNAGDIIWIRTKYEGDRPGSDQVVLGQGQINQDEPSSPVLEETPALSPVSTVSTAESSTGGKKGLKKKRSRMSGLLNYKKNKKEEKLPVKAPAAPLPTPKRNWPPPPAPPGSEELFLTSGYGFERRCGPGTSAVEFVPEIKSSVLPTDASIVTSYYSAAAGTNLIQTLEGKRAKGVYICGCVSNLSIYATLRDLVGGGFNLQLIQDCLGFRTLEYHDEALKIMLDAGLEGMGAGEITSTQMHEELDRIAGIGILTSPEMHRDLQAPLEENSSPETDVADIAESMSAMAIASNDGKSKATMIIAPQTSSPPPALKENKIRVRSRAVPRPPLNSQELVLEPVNKKIPIAGDTASNKPMLSLSEEDQVLTALSQHPPKKNVVSADAETQAALERLSIRGDDDLQSHQKPRSKSKSKRPKAKSKAEIAESNGEGSSEIREALAPASAFDSSAPQAVLDLMKKNRTLSEQHTNKTIQMQENHRQEEEPAEARAPNAKSVVSPPASSSDSMPAGSDASPPSNSHGKEAQNMLGDRAPTRKLKNLSNLPTLGPGDKIGEGDSSIRYELLPPTLRDELDETLPLSDTIFRALYHEVQWQKMYHAAGEVPRLVAVQGAIAANGDKPLYRHPSDQSPPLLPFTNHVNVIRKEAEKIIGHELNHVLIQLYRDGKDFISEHSDKTLDIMPGSKIVNASFGAQRTMRLRTKKSGFEMDEATRETQRVPMPHNSLFVLGLISNKIWLHGINPDKRLPAERSPVELAYNGKRISLTFRYIGTFLDKEEKLMWGQGAVGRSKDEARSVINGNEAETEKMIQAFSKENREGAGFVWREAYGCGFDVLHFRETADEL